MNQTSPKKATKMNWALLEYLSMIHILFTCKLFKKEKNSLTWKPISMVLRFFWVFFQHQTSPNTTINLNWTIFFFWEMGGILNQIFFGKVCHDSIADFSFINSHHIEELILICFGCQHNYPYIDRSHCLVIYPQKRRILCVLRTFLGFF